MKFHRRCGDRVTLLHDNTTAVRNFVEFNHGLILSADPLPDDVIFEVCIDRKVNVWNGSLEIGITTNDPEYMDLPATATKLRNTAWIMSGCSVVKDGVTLINDYGPELDSLHEGELLGVMRSSKGDLSFYVNGRCLGVAAEAIPDRVFAVIDLYGQCVQVTIVSPNYRRLEDPGMESINEGIEMLQTMDSLMVELPVPSTSNAVLPIRENLHIPITSNVEETLGEGADLYNNDWQVPRQPRDTHSDSSGSGDPDQERSEEASPVIADVMSDRCTDDDSREDRYDSIARGVRDAHLDSNVTSGRREDTPQGRCRVGMLYDWHLDQLTPYTGEMGTTSQFDNSLSEVSEAGLTSEESEAMVDEIRAVENRIVETIITMPDDDSDIVAQDKLRFHPRCGFLVKLSSNYRTAERTRPLDDYNNGVVMTHRPLRDDELFEIRIDQLVDKWSGSIEMGVTHHNPATIRYPSTMTNMDTGTIMMSGCKVLLNGHGTCLEYGNVNLDELREGDRVGVVRRSNGQLHYVINGVEQGVAAERVRAPVWGVVDLYGMTVKVTVQDTSEPTADSNIFELPPAAVATTPIARPEDPEPDSSRTRRQIDEESLLFHSLRDSHVTIINDGKTAHRPNAFEYFHNGIVMTNRTLRPNELFQVRLDLVIPKWAGSIEIGVTQHPSSDLKFPFRISTTTTGTWVLAGEDIVHNSNVIIPKYVRHLSRLKEGDTVGLARKHDGTLHFYINGADQGPAAFNVPEQVFGIVDLYGRVAQVTIADSYRPAPLAPFSPESLASSDSNATVYPEMCFHRVHGRNARLSRTRLTASRTAVYSEFNDAVLFSSRPLRECDMFELRIDAMVDCWIGSLEIGVTAIRPEDLESNGSIGSLAGTATDLNCDTYILSGAAMMKDGECVKSGYPLDLDTLSVGSRVGMMWHADRSIHYYLDGMDMGKAWYVPHLNIYAVVDLYGQCTQVTILQNEERTFNYNGRSNSDSLISSSRAIESPPPPYWSFSEYCGDNIKLMHDYSYAQRLNNDPMGALVFSSAHLAIDEIFEIKIIDCMQSYSGNLRMGVTDVNILNAHVNRHMPPSVNFLPHFTAYIDGRYMRYSRPGSREQETGIVTPSFEWLRAGDRVGLKRTADGRVLVYMNGDALDACFENVPDKVYVVMEMYGRTTKIQAVSKSANTGPAVQPAFANDAYYTASRFDENEAIQALYNINNEDRSDESVGAEKEPRDEDSVGQEDESSDSDEAPPDLYEDLGVDAPQMVFPQEEHVSRLPYTFHAVHGLNVRLLSSNTVARRITGYDYGIAAVSSPLRRGQTCWFRIDKVDTKFCGGLSIGAMPYLPIGAPYYLPHNALMLPRPSWVLTAELMLSKGDVLRNPTINMLETLEAGQAVGVRLENTGHIVIVVDRKEQICPIVEKVEEIGCAAEYTEIYPVIDLYGPIVQVSLTIHTNYVSLNSFFKEGVSPLKRKMKSVFDPTLVKSLVDRGIAYITHDPPCLFYKTLTPMTNFLRTPDVLGVRIPAPLDDDVFISELTRCLSLQNIQKKPDFLCLPIKPKFSYGLRFDEDLEIYTVSPERPAQNEPTRISKTSMRDCDLITVLTLEPSDLAETTEHTSSAWHCNDYGSYILRILNLNREEFESTSLEEEEWDSDGCEHLGVVLQYWRTLSGSYPQLHRAAYCGQVKCYCLNCEPNNTSSLSGWVRIERIEGVGAASRGYWHLNKAALSVVNSTGSPSRRPSAILSGLNVNMPAFELWIDDKGRPHVITLAIEIDTEGSNPSNDRLLAILLYVREPTPAEDSDGA